MKALTIAAAMVLAGVTTARADITPSEASRLMEAGRAVQDIQSSIPPDYWTRARCVVVIPDLKKAAFIVGGEYGKGLMSCRAGEGWSAPVFMQLAKGSWGFQAGAEQVDVVMLVMNESGVQKLLQNKVNLGADASVAAGPVGRQGQVGTDAYLTAEILAYSRAQGLFAGVDVSGGVLRPDEDANRHVYGARAEPRTVLAMSELSAPIEASPFLRALGSTAPPVRAQASQTPARPAAAVQPITDTDLRARLVDIQQTINKMLTEDARPVGTTGSSRDSVAVDRAALEQLRRQVEAALMSIDQR